MKRLFFISLLLAYCGFSFAQSVSSGSAAEASEKAYRIGETGPAGGLIFYDKGEFYDGWRYLEAAPADTEFTAQWGGRKQYIQGTGTTVGAGKRNTKMIVEFLNTMKKPETGRAAQICVGLEINGYNDWFLPSKDELELMYKNLRQAALGGFTDTWYWSSTQSRDVDAFGHNFRNGWQMTHNKHDNRRVRAIRSF